MLLLTFQCCGWREQVFWISGWYKLSEYWWPLWCVKLLCTEPGTDLWSKCSQAEKKCSKQAAANPMNSLKKGINKWRKQKHNTDSTFTLTSHQMSSSPPSSKAWCKLTNSCIQRRRQRWWRDSLPSLMWLPTQDGAGAPVVALVRLKRRRRSDLFIMHIGTQPSGRVISLAVNAVLQQGQQCCWLHESEVFAVIERP